MIKSIIRRIPLFADLSSAELDLLLSNLEKKEYPVETILFREGECGDVFYIVEKGEIGIIKAIGTPEERLLATRGPGDFIGEMSLLNRDGLRTATVRVNQAASLLELKRADFDALLAHNPEIAYQMLRVLSMRLKESQNRTIQTLTEKNRQLAKAYEELKAAQEQIVEKKILDRELRQARSIQESMLPKTLPYSEQFDFGARMLPARMIGGDFYDLFPLDQTHVGIAVGDVSGKGIPAALYMTLTIRLLRVAASIGTSPQETLQNVNQHLLALNTPGMFVTLLYGILDQNEGEFIYTRAGHELPLMWAKSGDEILLETGNGQLLGFFNNPILDTQSISIHPGDTLLLYSDGVTEAQNERSDLFGIEGLGSFVPPILHHPAQVFCDQLLDGIQNYCGNGPQSDDITILALKERA